MVLDGTRFGARMHEDSLYYKIGRQNHRSSAEGNILNRILIYDFFFTGDYSREWGRMIKIL